MARPASVDEYLAAQPAPQRSALEELRRQVRALVPEAEDVISYSIPAFRLRRRILLWYAGWKAHCSIYPVTDAFAATHAAVLEGYRRSKGTLRFPVGGPLPPDLLEAFVRHRMGEIDRAPAPADG